MTTTVRKKKSPKLDSFNKENIEKKPYFPVQKSAHRGFACKFFGYNVAGGLKSINANSLSSVKYSNPCWANFKYLNYSNNPKLYIVDFRSEPTEKYIPLLIKYLNTITPVELKQYPIDSHPDKYMEVIEFTLVPDTYQKNLVLLDFIRLLWHCPKVMSNVTFFKFLSGEKELPEGEKMPRAYFDRLVACLRFAFEDKGNKDVFGHFDHCNVGKGIVQRTRNEYLKWDGQSRMEDFMRKQEKPNGGHSKLKGF